LKRLQPKWDCSKCMHRFLTFRKVLPLINADYADARLADADPGFG
jgi:hypothetical protein